VVEYFLSEAVEFGLKLSADVSGGEECRVARNSISLGSAKELKFVARGVLVEDVSTKDLIPMEGPD
jgi:hypothetical protein